MNNCVGLMKIIIVTGGERGIGAEIVAHVLKLNMCVVVADLRVGVDTDRLMYVKTDVKQESAISELMEKTVKRFGRIDALINNAACTKLAYTPIEKTALEDWQEMIDINLTGTFLCSKYAMPQLKKNKGSIVNIASTRALQSEAHTEAYSATKGGIVALTHALAISTGPDVRVNCISPGWIHTDNSTLKESDHAQHPVGRVGNVEDIAAMVAFLISEQAGFITGQNFVIDGGMTKKMIYKESD